MRQLVEAIARKIPHELKNYHLIKRQDIYIPYCEIGITCLTKEVTEINLFFETILKLVNIGISDVYEIATIMGVDFKLLKETIVDMIEQHYMVTTENKLLITPKGNKAMLNREQVTIRKKNINQVAVNMITEQIEGNEKIMSGNIPKNSICLSEELIITKDFLESLYADINDIYQKNQIEFNVFNTRYLQRELYKILEIAYDRLYYVKEELLIYKNDDSADYEFLISGDIGERYLDCFYHQVRDVVFSGMENLFERDWNFAQKHYKAEIVSSEEKKHKNQLLKDLYRSEKNSEELLCEFIQTRELIDDSEIDMLFSYYMEVDFEGILISCERVRKILKPNIITSINQMQNKKIWLLYNGEEYDVQNFLERNFSELKKKKIISFLERSNSENQYICFYPNILIEFVERTEEIFGRPLTVVEGRIEFNSNIIKEKMEKIIQQNNLSFQLPIYKKAEKTRVGITGQSNGSNVKSVHKHKYKKGNK